MNKVVVFGAGLVVRAHVRYLLDHGFHVTVASRTVSKAEEIIDGHPNGTPMAYDITAEPERLESIIADHDVAVSLLPWQFHPQVARACLDVGKHMVTTSYVKEDMQALDAEAKEKGIILLNELGVDPGIDHMTAMQVIDRVHAEGGEITTFQSYCGGLPAPEANDNPYGYKFSWSPRGVLLAGLNTSRYRREGEVLDVPGPELFDHVWPVEVAIDGVPTELQGYANRDSMPYTKVYGIDPRDMMFRGTLRFPNWCAIQKQTARLGWLRTDGIDGLEGKTYADLTALLAGIDGTDDLKAKVAAHLGIDADGPELAGMEWLGLFGKRPAAGADGAGRHSDQKDAPEDVLRRGRARHAGPPAHLRRGVCRPDRAHHLDHDRLRHPRRRLIDEPHRRSAGGGRRALHSRGTLHPAGCHRPGDEGVLRTRARGARAARHPVHG